MNMQYESKIGWCPICNQGWVEFVKEPITNDIILLCSECDTVWRTPTDFFNNTPVVNYRFKGTVSPVTLEDLAAIGWDKYLDKS